MAVAGVGVIPTSYLGFQELGLPLIKPGKIFVSQGKGQGEILDIPRLFVQCVITTLIFLIIIIWFTLLLNASTRNQVNTDYLLFQFAVYFTVAAVFTIIFIVLLIS